MAQETVIDSRVAQLEAALAEISQREQGHLRSLDDALTKLHSTRKDVVGLRAQVATLHQEQARLTEALEEAQYQPEFWAVLRIVNRERDEAQAENARLLAFHQQRMRDEIKRAESAERQLAESIGKRLQLEDQIAAVLSYVDEWRSGDIVAKIVWEMLSKSLPASPPETARAEEPLWCPVCGTRWNVSNYCPQCGALGCAPPASPTPTKEPR